MAVALKLQCFQSVWCKWTCNDYTIMLISLQLTQRKSTNKARYHQDLMYLLTQAQGVTDQPPALIGDLS